MMSIAYDYSRDTSPVIPIAKDRLLLIDGRSVPSVSGRVFKSLNPATEQVIATIAEGNESNNNWNQVAITVAPPSSFVSAGIARVVSAMMRKSACARRW